MTDRSARFAANTTRDAVETARKAHNTSPVATAAAGTSADRQVR
ncbi:MAG: hypothetical protein ACLRPV_05700 [Lacrimispora saccharolytica]